MAGTSLLALIDDIATVLDDVAALTKIASKQTAGVLGDDLALNAQQVAGVHADRELPVVWAVAKGSMVNKAILVPAALAISALAHWAVTPLLMLGGAYLCFEGAEKVVHRLLHPPGTKADELQAVPVLSQAELRALEKAKIKGAVRTDFILSAEIVAITLGIVADAAFGTQVAVLAGTAVLMTVGVYGLVAGIVKLDDAGLYLVQRTGKSASVRLTRLVGHGLLRGAPLLMRFLGVAGTVAMFLVGGGILSHGAPAVEHWLAGHVLALEQAGGLSAILATVLPSLANISLGLALGLALVGVVALGQKVFRRKGVA